MIYRKLLPVLLLVSMMAGSILTPSKAEGSLHSVIKNYKHPEAVITVCASGCDHTSIQYAINLLATDGDTIQLSSETYTETININKSITLIGEGRYNTILQAAGNPALASNRVIQVTNGITVVIDGLSIQNGNSASDGGGILNEGNLNLNNSRVVRNIALNGGGIANISQLDTAKITISNSIIRLNEASLSGGGIFNYSPAPNTLAKAAVFSSTISSNQIDQASSSGGGAANIAGQGTSTMSTTNSTISANVADKGGGVYIQSDISGTVTTTLEHITFFGNSSEQDGSNLYAGNGQTKLKHSILAYGQVSDDCYRTVEAVIIDEGYNLVEDPVCGFPASGDPLLLPVDTNGGNTRTHALTSSSPALDFIPLAHCSTSIDQRGFRRPYGFGCDSGAYESNTNEVEFSLSANDTDIEPGGQVSFSVVLNVIGPGITGGIISSDFPPELTIQEPILLDPPGSGVIGSLPTLAHSIEITANHRLTVTMGANVAEGLPAGTKLDPSVNFTSNEIQNPQEDSVTLNVVNLPPFAVDDIGPGFRTSPNVTSFHTASVLDNDYDLNGDTLIILLPVNTDELKGTITYLGDGQFSYNPNDQFDHMKLGDIETDSFTYTIWDGDSGIGGEDATAKVTITIINGPFAVFLPLAQK